MQPGFAGATLLLGSLFALSRVPLNALGVVAGDIAESLDIRATAVSLLSSAVFVGYAAAQLPFALVVALRGPMIALLCGTGLLLVGTALFGLVGDFDALLAARLLTGIGAAPIYGASVAFLGAMVAHDQLPMVAANMSSYGRAGVILASAPLAFAVAAVGWEEPFLWSAAAIAALGLCIWVLLASGASGAAARPVDPQPLRRHLKLLAGLMRRGHLPAIALLMGTTNGAVTTLTALWGGRFVVDSYGFDVHWRGIALLAVALAMIPGALVAGSLARGHVGRIRALSLGYGLLLAAAFAVGGLVPLPEPALWAWLVLLGLLSGNAPLAIAEGARLVEPPDRILAVALTTLIAMLVQSAMMVGSGVLVDSFGHVPGQHPPEAFRAVFLMLALCILPTAGAYLLWAAPRAPAEGVPPR
jgi:MFS family permease